MSQAERERLSEFPSEISDHDLMVYFSLTPADRVAIQQHIPHTQLGFALLLGTLRSLDFFPAKLDHLPEEEGLTRPGIAPLPAAWLYELSRQPTRSGNHPYRRQS